MRVQVDPVGLAVILVGAVWFWVLVGLGFLEWRGSGSGPDLAELAASVVAAGLMTAAGRRLMKGATRLRRRPDR